MRTNFILKQIIDILFYILGLSALGSIIITLISVFTFNFETIAYISYPFQKENNWIIPITILNILTPIFFFLGIGYLREVAKCFLNKKWYKENIAKQFRISGRYLTITSILGLASSLIYTFTTKEHCKTGDLSLRHGNLIIFMLITGLCFIMISRVLKETIDAKQENDLTI